MIEYASVFELEEMALRNREELLGEGKDMYKVAERIGKPWCSIKQLDSRIARIAEEQKIFFSITPNSTVMD